MQHEMLKNEIDPVMQLYKEVQVYKNGGKI